MIAYVFGAINAAVFIALIVFRKDLIKIIHKFKNYGNIDN